MVMLCLGGFSTVNPDGIFRLALTHSLLTEGSFVTPNGPINYAPLQSLLMVPVYALGYLYGTLKGVSPDHLFAYGSVACYFFYLPVIVSALLVLFFKVLQEMGVDEDTRLLSTFILFWCTFLLPYSKGMFSDPLNALLMLASFYYYLKAQSSDYLRYQRRNFFCLGLLILNNFVFVLYFALMLFYAFGDSRFRRKDSREAGQVTLEGLFVMGAAILLFLGYNYARFGEWFNFGYAGEGFTSNILEGLYGLLFSFGKGLILFSPLTVLCVLFFMFKNHTMESRRKYVFGTTLISFVCFVFVYAKWSSWHGGICWGPRFLLPFVPLIHLLFPFLWQSVVQDNRLLKTGIILAGVWGFGINLLNIADPHIANQLNTQIPFPDQVFLPEQSILFQIIGSGVSASAVLKGIGILAACAISLWAWKKFFSLEIPASRLTASHTS